MDSLNVINKSSSWTPILHLWVSLPSSTYNDTALAKAPPVPCTLNTSLTLRFALISFLRPVQFSMPLSVMKDKFSRIQPFILGLNRCHFYNTCNHKSIPRVKKGDEGGRVRGEERGNDVVKGHEQGLAPGGLPSLSNLCLPNPCRPNRRRNWKGV